jgi:hypothetical protein
MIQADAGEITEVGIGLCGWWGQHIHAAVECDGMANFISTVGFGPENTASGQLGL